MKRITKKRDGYGYELAPGQEVYAEEGGIRLVQVVGEYEDLCDKLGCDPMKVVKALTEGCWIKNGEMGICYLKSNPEHFEPSELHIGLVEYHQHNSAYDYGSEKKDTCLCIFDMWYEDINHIARLSDYGKTWALTKEELTNE